MIWKTALDPRERWFEPESGALYDFFALPLPDGDLDGDGTADVVLKKDMPWGWNPSRRHTATLPLQALSGRTGARLWSAGPLPLSFAARGYSQVMRVEAGAFERDGPRDLLVRHWSPFVARGTQPFPGPASDGRPSLARLSGQNGQVLWHATLGDYIGWDLYAYAPPTLFHDLDGDGSLEALVVLPAPGGPPHRLLVISLGTGTIRWSKPFSTEYLIGGDVLASDLDGDGHLEVAAIDRLNAAVHVYDGHDGKDRWTWTSRISSRSDAPSHWMALADFAGKGRKNLCVQVKDRGGKVHVVVLDGNGKERARRNFTTHSIDTLEAADCNGDGRDELLMWYGDALHALDGELHELWSWRTRSVAIDRILPGSQGQAGSVILAPALALSGATGVPLWTGQAPLIEKPPQFSPRLLDSGGTNRLPLLIGQGLGATVCRVALPPSASGKIAPPSGAVVRTVRVPSDPRWSRPLPWVARLKGFFGPTAIIASMGLALVNFGLPFGILLLAAPRRRFDCPRTDDAAAGRGDSAGVVSDALAVAARRHEPRNGDGVAGIPVRHTGGLADHLVRSLDDLEPGPPAVQTDRHRGRLDARGVNRSRRDLGRDRHEVDACDRALRFGRLVPCWAGGGIRRDHVVPGDSGPERSLRADEAATTQVISSNAVLQARGGRQWLCSSSLSERSGAIAIFIRGHRHTTLIALAAAVCTVIVSAGAIVAWGFYAEWRLGRVELLTEEAPLRVQVLAESSDTPIGEPFDVVTRAVVTLPAGDYRLYIRGNGRLSRTYRFAVNRGEMQTHSISLNEGRLLGGERPAESEPEERTTDAPIPFCAFYSGGRTDPGEGGLDRVVGRFPDPAQRRPRRGGLGRAAPRHALRRRNDPASWIRSVPIDRGECRLVEPATDFDADSTRDLLWYFPNAAALLALSGVDGSMLWNYGAELDAPGGPLPEGPGINSTDDPSRRNNRLAGVPAIADVNRDGVPDVLATFILAESEDETAKRTKGRKLRLAREYTRTSSTAGS